MQEQKSLNNLPKVSQGQDKQGLNADLTPSLTQLEKDSTPVYLPLGGLKRTEFYWSAEARKHLNFRRFYSTDSFYKPPLPRFQASSNCTEHRSCSRSQRAPSLPDPPGSRAPKFPGVVRRLPGLPAPGAPRARDRPPLPYAVREAILARVLPRLARASATAAACAWRPWTAGVPPREGMRSAPAAPGLPAPEHAQSARRGRPGEVPAARRHPGPGLAARARGARAQTGRGDPGPGGD